MELQREDLEKLYADTFKERHEGEVVKGKVIQRRDDGVIIDLGTKSEGFIPSAEILDRLFKVLEIKYPFLTNREE